MIRLTIAATEREMYVRPDAIYTIEAAPPTQKYHHIYSIVTLTNGDRLECRQDAQWVADRWAGKVDNTEVDRPQSGRTQS